jgi:thymidylate synthase
MTSEQEYLKLLKDVVETGIQKPDRTGTGVFSKFAQQLRYPLTNEKGEKVLPLLTTKRVSFKLVYSELLWILSGETNIDFLKKHNNHIWDGNTSKDFLNKRGLDYEEGELGPGYGWQWRNFNGEYPNGKKGVDQIKWVIENIKNDPFSRRHVVSAWNPYQLDEVALPPCHHMFMFFVTPNKELNCHLIMRSNDMFLGHPFNVASYATLTHMIAHLTGLKANELVITMNDCHVYQNHVDQVEEQCKRDSYEYPTLKILGDPKDIDDFDMDSVKVVGYKSHPYIKAPMAV